MNTVDRLAKTIWEYMLLKQPLEKADAVFVLGSRDDRVAEYAAKLFLQGFGKWLIISGGAAHQNDLLSTNWKEATEAEHFKEVALKLGVPDNKIILETKATNTGENIRFTFELLKNKKLDLQSLILVQKPYMERRTYATFKKQWPDPKTKFLVSSPPITFEEYFTEDQPKDDIINIMVGDLQRIREYPKQGFQIEQEIPNNVWAVFEELTRLGFTKHLIK